MQILLAFPKILLSLWVLPSTSKALFTVTIHHHILPVPNRLFIFLFFSLSQSDPFEMYANKIIPILCSKHFNDFPSLSSKNPKSLKWPTRLHELTWYYPPDFIYFHSVPHHSHLGHSHFLAICSSTPLTLQATLCTCSPFCLKKPPSDIFMISLFSFFRSLF